MSGIVIVGSGLAGYNLARELRRHDVKVPITLLTADTGDSYSKPMFSGAASHGQQPDDLVLASMESQAKFLGLKIHARTAVEEILVESRQVLCSRRGKLDYGSLVLATGASPLQVPLTGTGAREVLGVHSLDDYRRWHAAVSALPPMSPVMVLGAGHVALEFACELIAMGMEPHIVAPDEWPLQSLLPEQIGMDVLGGLRQSGVEFHLGSMARRIDVLPEATVKDSPVRYQVELSDGSHLRMGAVLVAVGMEPNIELAEQAGIATRKGILVDRSLRTSLSDVYALGDVAEIEGVYMPYVTPLIAEAKVLSEVLLGRPAQLRMTPPLVHIKCPLHALVVCPPLRPVNGEWEIEVDSRGCAAYLRSEQGHLLGFALTRERIKDRLALQASLLPLWE